MARMTGLRLATGPVTWGVDFADTPSNPPWQQVLDEISESGIGALELGPVGYLPEDAGVLSEALKRRDLTAVGSFIFDNMHAPAEADGVVASAVRACKMIAACGGRILVIIDRPSPERESTAGRSDVAERLGRSEWHAMIATISRVAEVAREAGLTPTVHPHVGSYIEFDDEIERLVDDTELDLCLDTGHLAYARIDPTEAIRRYENRLGHVHLKDIRSDVLQRVDAESLSFWAALREGIFCPLGEGLVDVYQVVRALEDINFEGFATIEQDRVPGSGTPLDDLRSSLQVLAAAGA